MRKLIFNLHLYGALVVSIFLVVVAATGSIIAFEDDLDRLVNPNLYKVAPRAEPISLAGILQAAAKSFPGQKMLVVTIPEGPSNAASLLMSGARRVFMNPHTYEILGQRGASFPLQQIHKMHISLLMGP